jgi:hypothetical protein
MNMLKKLGLGIALVGVAYGFQVSIRVDASAALREHILQNRPAPLTNLNVAVSLNVKDFGAIPDDGLDDRAAVAAAIAEARSLAGPVQIDFNPGTYDFTPSLADFSATPNNAAVLLQNCTNLVLDGHDADILIHRQDVAFVWVRYSTNLIIRNFSVDYDPLPFSQGTVQSVDTSNGSFIFALQDGFPVPDDPFFKSCYSWGMLKDSTHPGRLKAKCPSFFRYSDVSSAGSNLYRIALTTVAQISNFSTGEVFVINGRSGSIAYYQNSENITFDHLTAYACPSSLFIGSQTSLLNVLNCKGQLKGSRLIVSGADGVHCQAARIGPWVENCDFEGLSDDCLNIYGLPTYILSQNSSTQLTVHAQSPIRPGDRLVFFNPTEGRIIADTTAASISGNSLTLTDPINETLNIAPSGTVYDAQGWNIYDHIYNGDAVGNYFVYRNNHMHDGRRFGMFIKASYGLIENNRFDGLSNQGLYIANTPSAPEGFWAQNLIIRGNTISECGYGDSSPCALIASRQFNGTRELFMTTPIQKNIYLLDNVFNAVSGAALKLSGVSGLVARGNEFISGSATGSLVTIQYSENISWTNNLDQGRIQYQ